MSLNSGVTHVLDSYRFPGSPPLPRDLVRYPCAARQDGAPAQLAHWLPYCKCIRRAFPTSRHTPSRLAQCSATSPRLGCDCSAANRGPNTTPVVSPDYSALLESKEFEKKQLHLSTNPHFHNSRKSSNRTPLGDIPYA